MKNVEELLRNSGISPTPVRMLVYKCLRDSSSPKSLSDIEEELESVDKSTISRTLSLLREHHLLHSFNDGSGSVKYETCSTASHDMENDTHVHFRCQVCGRTICLTSISIPEVVLPQGFVAKESNYIISGTCKECGKES